MSNYYKGRFTPLTFCLIEDDVETILHLFMDRKVNGFSLELTQQLLCYLKECIYSGKIIDTCNELDLDNKINEKEFIFQQYISYSI